MKNLLTDSEIIAKHSPSVRHRAQIELTICHRVISDLMSAGYSVAVNDGEETTPDNATEQELINAIFSVDESHIYTATANGKDSFIFLVMGNDGHDVISDYGMSLEPVIGPILEWIDQQIDNGSF